MVGVATVVGGRGDEGPILVVGKSLDSGMLRGVSGSKRRLALMGDPPPSSGLEGGEVMFGGLSESLEEFPDLWVSRRTGESG